RNKGCDRCIRFHRRRESCCLFHPLQKSDTARSADSCWQHRGGCVQERVCERPPISACAFRRRRFPCRVLRTYGTPLHAGLFPAVSLFCVSSIWEPKIQARSEEHTSE